MKKATPKSKAARSMRDLPAKRLRDKAAKGVKGGGENVSLNYGTVKWTYTQQGDSGPQEKK